MNLTKEMLAELAKPFPASAVSWKPQKVDGDRALAVAYIDARDVAQRLDEVCSGDWGFTWEPVPGGGKAVRGTLRIGDTVREDVGEAGEGDFGDTWKAAVSDALKRAAVQYGVARYLYRLPAVWVAYDPQRRRLKEIPPLPAWARPEGDTSEPVVAEGEPQAESKEAGGQPEGKPEGWCELHQVQMRQYSKDGRTWWSHRLDDGTWCKGQPAGDWGKSFQAWWKAQLAEKGMPDVDPVEAWNWLAEKGHVKPRLGEYSSQAAAQAAAGKAIERLRESLGLVEEKENVPF